MNENHIALFPAYKPGPFLLELAQNLWDSGFYVVIVDDGNGPQYENSFSSAADMLYAFTFPLVGGVLPFSVMNICRWKRHLHALARNLYHSGIATLSIGSIVQGVLEVYGTTNALTGWY